MNAGRLIEIERQGPLALLRLNRPDKRNAMNEAMLREFNDATKVVAADSTCRIAILTGQGASFCAGADLSLLATLSDDDERRRVFEPWAAHLAELIREAMHRLLCSDVVTIAAVNGPAVGGGWAVALACDFRIASEAARFWFPEAAHGRVVGMPTRRMLAHYLPVTRVREVLMTRTRYSAAQALAMGLLSDVTAAQALLPRTHALVGELLSVDRRTLITLKHELGTELKACWAAA